jgi:hypothetical protein
MNGTARRLGFALGGGAGGDERARAAVIPQRRKFLISCDSVRRKGDGAWIVRMRRFGNHRDKVDRPPAA